LKRGIACRAGLTDSDPTFAWHAQR